MVDSSVRRGVTPVVGVVLLVGITVALAAAVGTALTTPELSQPPTATLSLEVDTDTDRIALTHRGGDTLDVSGLNVTIAVDGTRLAEQPPVPFFAADGFETGPTGPFNSKSPDTWGAGETAGVRVASTNAPTLSSGVEVTVTVVADGSVVQERTTTAG